MNLKTFIYSCRKMSSRPESVVDVIIPISKIILPCGMTEIIHRHPLPYKEIILIGLGCPGLVIAGLNLVKPFVPPPRYNWDKHSKGVGLRVYPRSRDEY